MEDVVTPDEHDVFIARCGEVDLYVDPRINMFTIIENVAEHSVMLTRDESISVSRAILKHFGEKSE